jgi:hypothetical protein
MVCGTLFSGGLRISPLADGVVEGRGRGPTDTVAAESFEFEISSDTDDICLFLYIINTLCSTHN